ncbi:hypothetical protein WFA24289_00742 [Periweissella fabaria]|uniref:DoxX family protein n=2 Tax=Periweissella fabaria TaxID=546157 RepID=A0ABN8BJ40_9LACO|nr:hypothetical protein WFA24289_00742 [Periweissella fabaria]
MIMQFLRTNQAIMYGATVLRVWLGYLWLISGIDKIMHGFSAHKFINMAIKNPVQGLHGEQFPWFTTFLKITTANGTQTKLYSCIVPWAEILVGLGLIIGLFTLIAAFGGLIMNFVFIFAGTISSNPLFIIAEMLILVIGSSASRLGLDYWVLSWLHRHLLSKSRPYEPYEPHF